MTKPSKSRRDALLGTLLGTALGDALGLPAEGLSAKTIQRRFGRIDRFRLLGKWGFVSDDTEQTALVAQSLLTLFPAGGKPDIEACHRAFRRAMKGWILRLPFGIGFGTLRSCLKLLVGMRNSGVPSAGNGAAMRAAIIGAAIPDDGQLRLAVGRRIAETTHRDPRAVEGALYVAELAALALSAKPDADRSDLGRHAMTVVSQKPLREVLLKSQELARAGASLEEAAKTLGTSGFVIHSLPFALFCFLQWGGDPARCISETIRGGGDTDTNAAVAGALSGALCGEKALPRHLVESLCGGPFGPAHLRSLAEALCGKKAVTPPGYSWMAALLRNLLLYPVILAHGFRRMLPF